MFNQLTFAVGVKIVLFSETLFFSRDHPLFSYFLHSRNQRNNPEVYLFDDQSIFGCFFGKHRGLNIMFFKALTDCPMETLTR